MPVMYYPACSFSGTLSHAWEKIQIIIILNMSEIPVTNLHLARKREKEKEKRTNICLRNS